LKVCFMRRKPISDYQSRKLFSRTSMPHPKNTRARPLRGGIRL